MRMTEQFVCCKRIRGAVKSLVALAVLFPPRHFFATLDYGFRGFRRELCPKLIRKLPRNVNISRTYHTDV